MIETAIQDEELLDQILIDILRTDSTLREIPPYRALEDDGARKDLECSLSVQSTFTGKEIGIVCSYSVMVKLERRYNGGVGSQDFVILWRKILTLLKSPPTGIDIYAHLSHLTFDDLESSADAQAAEAEYSRSVTFRVFMSRQ